VKINIRNYL